MGRKSKTAKRAATGPTIDKIEKYEDTLEEGGVDDFMFKRDQIHFNKEDESDDDINAGQGEAVLSLGDHDDDDHEEYDDGEGEGEYDEDEGEWDVPTKKARKEKVKPDLSTKGRYGKEQVSSDEYSEDDDDKSGSGSDEEEEGWGRQYYSRPSTRRAREKEDEYDEKREEEREMEEKEVRRLQRRAREALAEDDWGLDDVEVEYAEKPSTAAAEAAPAPVAPPKTDDPETLVRHLQAHEPLKLALARDFPLVLRKLRSVARGIKRMMRDRGGEESLFKGLGWLHYQALLTYATTLAFYIHLCALPAEKRPDMSTHPILQRLLQLKEGVAALEEQDCSAGSVSDAGPELFIRDPFAAEFNDESNEVFAAMQNVQDVLDAKRELMDRMGGAGMPPEEDEIESDEEDEMVDLDEDAANLWAADADGEGLDDDELADLLADAEAGGKKSKKEKKDKKEKKRSRGKKAKAAVDSDSDADEQPSTAVAFTPMAEPEFVASKKSKKKSARTLSDADEVLGDSTELSEADAGDKERRKRSLRFHTAKIAATSARRSAARDRRLGGDDDIPYRDRQAARDAALRKNAPKGAGEGEDLDGSEWTESDRKRAREVRDEGEGEEQGDDGYYELVKRRKIAKEEAKAAKHDEFLADKFASFEDETADGPRALTRAIEKNRGLTPRRSKTGRNPRVKKKLAYEKAKQKVGSQRAVYKGGQSALSGAYTGEKTGISTVSKSRKF